jgi:tRNA1(Val) A37 N6-methylase TrmN6
MSGDAGIGSFTEDAVLGGRLRLRQPRRGHRVGHDAILLAAATPARAGEHVVDLGAGVGSAGLALAARVPGTTVTLVEIDPGLAALAAENAQRNGLAARALTLDVRAPARAFAAAGLPPEKVARVMMNPQFTDPARHRASPDRQRRVAHAAPRDSLPRWVQTAARLLRPRGTLSLIFNADGLADVLRALEGAFGAMVILPVHGKAGEGAIRVLVRATKGSGAPLALLPGLVLNDRAGRPTAEAEAVLRAGAVLPLGEIHADR